MDFAKQRAAELYHQKAALRQEFADWRTQSQKGAALEKHQSQIERITRQLDAFLDLINEPGELVPVSFKACQTVYTHILGAYRIWAYFRSKLVLRYVPLLHDDLITADEFAWACYQPARQGAKAAKTIAIEQLKEPPLVFFSHFPDPFMQGRETYFQPEGITGQDVMDFGMAVLSLPVPVIGLPWFQVNHLPTAVLIAHEIGHAVEQDFDLETPLQKSFDALDVPDDRRVAWLAWWKEIFADVYGILCVGPAYVIALMAYLVNDPETIHKQLAIAPNWGEHPPDSLRMKVNFEMLDRISKEYAGLRQAWIDTYTIDLMTSFEPDIPNVIEALLATPLPAFGNVCLRNVIDFTPNDVARIRALAKDHINGGLAIPEGEPFRRLFASITLANNTDPETYDHQNTSSPVLRRLVKLIPEGVRSAEKVFTEQEQKALANADAQAGKKLLSFFTSTE